MTASPVKCLLSAGAESIGSPATESRPRKDEDSHMHALFLTTALLLGAKPAAAPPAADDAYDTVIDGKPYRCSTSDITGRYETVCTPSDETAAPARGRALKVSAR